jgi:hypothetical protein
MHDLIKVMMLGKPQGMAAGHLAHEDKFAGIPELLTEHHGNLAGSNEHQDAEIGFIIGGAFPDPADVLSIAAARGAGALLPTAPVPTKRAALLTSGAAVAIECLAYDNPDLDVVHRGIYEGSIVQAVGRMRPMNRTADNPAIGYVFANVALPFPVTSVRRWSDIKPSRIIRMIANGRVWLNASHMALFRPDLFKSAKAAEHARAQFAKSTDDALDAVKAIVRNDRQPWVKLVYQRRGQGQRRSYGILPATDEKAAREEIEAEFGELRSCRCLPFTPGREVVPTPGKEPITQDMGVTSPEPPPPPAAAGPERTYRTERPPDG